MKLLIYNETIIMKQLIKELCAFQADDDNSVI